MTTATTTQISAPAISRIISANTDLPKARATGWSLGFYVSGYDSLVAVGYQDTNRATQENALTQICDLINGRADRKYTAELKAVADGTSMVHVTVRQEAEEDRMEQLAEESPYGVTVKEVRAAMNQGRRFYEFEEGRSAGFLVEREAAPHDRLVRVTYRDTLHTTYAPGTGGRDVYAHTITTHYANVLVAAGYAVCIDHTDADGDSLLVGQPGEFTSQEQAAEQAVEPLNELRVAVEADSLSYMTRKAGPTSLFVYYLVPFRDKVRRVEVFWTEGIYRVSGRFGGVAGRAEDLTGVLPILRSELAELAD